ncbi:hypothetical protein ES319_A05G279500v1 [Gossypium barbadense]|uniref:Uncharacterized protein n=2 Tax=Gossypium TaxID=3633 RepID=A0A5J5VVD8_GOSBA|nr:hypothetical protein ES319_A05G279500v1 [Gossypium barbadense]TYH18653.1 hypothetical protein ES288_A05G290000v1 [Gossypium darwinii]
MQTVPNLAIEGVRLCLKGFGTAVRRSGERCTRKRPCRETARGSPTPWHCSGTFQKLLVLSAINIPFGFGLFELRIF